MHDLLASRKIAAILFLLFSSVVSNAQGDIADQQAPLLEVADAHSASGYQAHVINPDLNVVFVSTEDSSVFAAGSDGTIWRSHKVGHGWEDVSPQGNSSIATMAFSREWKRLLAVGNDGLILTSEDHGKRWQRRDSGVMDNLLAISSGGASGKDLLAVGLQGTAVLSSDGGEHWSSWVTGTSVSLASVLYLKEAGEWLIGGEKGFLARSSGQGRTWTVSVNACQGAITKLLKDPQRQVVYATCGDGKILQTKNAGKSWQVVFSGPTNEFITNLVQSPETGVVIATTAHGGIVRLSGKSSRWQYVRATGQYLSAVAFVPGKKGEAIVVAGDRGSLIRSDDAGKRWASIKLPNKRRILDLGYDASNPSLIAVGNGGLIMASEDQGRHWSIRHIAPDGYVHALGRDPYSGVLLAIGSDRMVARSSDEGTHWQVTHLEQLVVPANLSSLGYLPRHRAFVVAGGQRTLMESTDAGASWNSFSVMGDSYKGVIVDPQTETVLAYGDQGALGRMDSPQASPERLSAFTDKTLFGGMSDSHGNFWVFGEDGIVAHSSDLGLHWRISTPVTSAKLFAGMANSTGKILMVVGNAGNILRSMDSGQTWQIVATPTRAPLRWIVSVAKDSVLLVTGGNGTILRSTDQGASWQQIPSGTLETLRGPILSSENNDMFIVGRGGIILCSHDQGVSWQRIDSHSTARFKHLLVDRGGKLWAHGDRLVRLDPVVQ